MNKMKAPVKANSCIVDRWEKEDRRYFGPPTQFPFRDCDDILVKKDRRYRPDRRIANIQVKKHFSLINLKH